MSRRCETLLCHDVVKSAIAYSTMAGVLASVAFLAIVFLLESQLRRRESAGRERARDRGLDNVSVSLISAFLNMIIATFLYAALSGEDVLGPRAATLGFIASISISVGFLNLLYGAVWLFETLELVLTGAVTRTIAALIAPAVTFIFIGIRSLDMLSLAEGRRSTRSWVGLVLLIMVICLVALFIASVRWRSAIRARSLTSDRAVRATTYGALVIGVLAVFATGVVSQLRVSFAVPRWGVALTMSILFLAYSAYIALVAAVRALQQAGEGRRARELGESPETA